MSEYTSQRKATQSDASASSCIDLPDGIADLRSDIDEMRLSLDSMDAAIQTFRTLLDRLSVRMLDLEVEVRVQSRSLRASRAAPENDSAGCPRAELQEDLKQVRLPTPVGLEPEPAPHGIAPPPEVAGCRDRVERFLSAFRLLHEKIKEPVGMRNQLDEARNTIEAAWKEIEASSPDRRTVPTLPNEAALPGRSWSSEKVAQYTSFASDRIIPVVFDRLYRLGTTHGNVDSVTPLIDRLASPLGLTINGVKQGDPFNISIHELYGSGSPPNNTGDSSATIGQVRSLGFVDKDTGQTIRKAVVSLQTHGSDVYRVRRVPSALPPRI